MSNGKSKVRESTKENGVVSTIQSRLEDSRFQLISLGVLSFLESTFLPIPLEIILIPYLVTHRDRLWRATIVVTLGCLIGATLGYGLGSFLPEEWGATLRSWFAGGAEGSDFESQIKENGFFAILTVGITPVPFQLAMLTAGASAYPFPLYLLAVLIARGLRYFGLAILVWLLGDRALQVWKKNKLLACVIAIIILVLLFGVSKLLNPSG